MRNVLLKSCLFFGLVLVTLLSLYLLNLEKVKLASNVYEFSRQKNLLAKKDSIFAISLGNSRNKAINFEVLELKGYQFYRHGGDLYEAYFSLLELAEDLPNLKTIFIPIHYTELSDNLGYEGIRRQFYSLRPMSLPLPNDFRVWLKSKFYFFSSDFDGEKINDEDLNSFELSEYGVIQIKEQKHSMNLDELLKQGSLRAEKHVTHMKSRGLSEAEMVENLSKAVKNLIATAKQKGYRLIFYTPPTVSSYLEKMEESYTVDPRKLLTKIAKQESVEYFDFSNVNEMNTGSIMFKDPDHLNVQTGSVVFSKMLKQAMEL